MELLRVAAAVEMEAVRTEAVETAAGVVVVVMEEVVATATEVKGIAMAALGTAVGTAVGRAVGTAVGTEVKGVAVILVVTSPVSLEVAKVLVVADSTEVGTLAGASK